MPNVLAKNGALYNEELEKAIINCLINDNDALVKGINILREEYFYSRKCRIIFRAIKELNYENEDIDLVILRNRLLNKTENELKEANITDKSQINVEYFADITSMINYSPRAIEKYCTDLKEIYTRRKLKKYCEENILLSCVKNEGSIYDVLQDAQKELFDLSKQEGDKDFESLRELIPKVLDKMSDASKIKGGLIGITSGFKLLDSYTQGFQKQDLIIIAARPATGKTSLALNMAYNMAKAGKKVVFFSLEMGGMPLTQRLMSMESLVSSELLRSGQLSDAQWDKVMSTSVELEKYSQNILFNTNSTLTIAELQNKCRKLKSENNLDCVMIDYLQLMHAGRDDYNGKNSYSKSYNNRQEEVAEISRALKGLARDLDIPVIALAQVNRAAEKNAKLQLSDIKESGQIEQDADIVIMIEKQKFEDPNDSTKQVTNDDYASDKVILNIAKHRNGKTGDVELRFDRATTRFDKLDSKY